MAAASAESSAPQAAAAADRLPAPTDAAHQLAKDVIKALGGMEKVRGLFDAMSLSKGKMTDFSAMSGAANTVEVELLSRREKFKIDLQVLGQKAITGYNGKIAWQQHGTEIYPSDPVTTRKIAEDASHGALLLLKFEDPSLKMSVLPDQTCAGKSCPGLEVVDESGKWTRMYIDPDTHMVLAVEYMGMDFEQGTEALKRSEYSDYRPLLGSFIAFKAVEYTGGKKTSEQILESAELKDGLDDSVFDMPQRKTLEALARGPVVIPFEYVSNEVLVKAKVNDRVELRFLLDTGATQNVMERSSATTFGTVAKSGMSITTGSGFVEMGGIVLQSLQLGDLRLTDVPMAVADMPGFAQMKGNRPAGILGANILRRFAVTIDYDQRKIYFRDPQTLVIPDGATVLQAQPALGSVGLSVDGLADDKLKLRLLVDTGAAFNSIAEPLLKPLLDFPLLPVGSVEGVDGYKVEVGAVQLNNLKLDKLLVDAPVVSVTTIPAVNKMPAGLLSASSLGILGNPYWSHFRLTVDYLNGRIILEQSANSKSSQAILADLRKVFTNYLKDGKHDAAVTALDSLLAKARASDMLKTRTVVAIYKAKILAEKDYASGNAALQKNAYKAFETPYVLAKESNEPNLEAKVIANQCIFLLDNGPVDIAELQNVRKLLQMASGLSENEPDLLVAAAVYFGKAMPFSSTRRMLDQALVLDPANWRGLLERYQLAKKDPKSVESRQILELLHHYYPGCNPPGLSPVAGAEVHVEPHVGQK